MVTVFRRVLSRTLRRPATFVDWLVIGSVLGIGILLKSGLLAMAPVVGAVALHAAWLISVALALPKAPSIHWAALAGYVVLELLRAWTMWSLGPYWTTRIVTLPDAALVRRGPYRFLRHPNYVIVTGEIALLPLIFGELWVAAIFSLLNAMLLFWRIREEESALAPRRALGAG